MTVSTELSHEEYVGNGVTTDFDFRFRIFESRHLIVVVADNDGNETTLKNGTDYTIVGAGSYHGGKVVLNKPLARGWTILLERDLPVVQETDLRNQGKFFAEVHEDAFDYLTMLIQKALGTFSLSLRKPTYLSNYYDAKGNRIANLASPKVGTDAANKDYVDNSIKYIDSNTLRVKDNPINALPNTEQRANKILAFDYNGQPITVLPESGSASDVLIEFGKPTGASMIGVQPSGNLQQIINFITFEQFGAIGDGVHDDTQSINDAISYLNPYPNKASSNEMLAINNAGGGVIKLQHGKKYRFTKTLNIPSNISIIGDSMFSQREPSSCLFYDGDINSAALATLTYKLNADGIYDINRDYDYLPDGTEFDSGKYYSCGRNVELSCSIITKHRTKVGLFWVGASGGSTYKLSIGENGISDDYHTPLCAMVSCCSWGSVHYHPRLLAYSQVLHCENANGGVTFYSPYANRPGTENSENEEPVYGDFNLIGAVGISCKNAEPNFIEPVIEHSYYPMVIDSSVVNVIGNYIESTGSKIKNTYYISNNSKVSIKSPTFTHSVNIPGSSVFYFKNMSELNSRVFIDGNIHPTLGYTLCYGENSGRALNLQDVPVAQLQYGKIGDASLINSISFIKTYTRIFINESTGSDINYGLHGTSPVKTLKKALELADCYKFDNISIYTQTTVNYSGVDEYIDLPKGISSISFDGIGSLNIGNARVRVNSDLAINNKVRMNSNKSSVFYLNKGVSCHFHIEKEITGSYSSIHFSGCNIVHASIVESVNLSNLTLFVSSENKKNQGVLIGVAEFPEQNKPSSGVSLNQYINSSLFMMS
ncbi:glycosyl hydrolase family 28-related protein [Proteus sp. G2662]|uniref:glycosyl hydrolase family 28-related protein n=1 Tax=Proteus sp. G2662 TaxID=2698875 RepID=UPI0013766474|nr:glycosyl hydrolase family 28-related protein [Proteus sp. G2662]NBM95113.1 hypothetical protein [Proteus sp. G2662]